ncbi:MAG TPA: LysR family transcriptional regulator [Acidimicrobiales bacterium]|nr:LysR family transcriptional regulator [Acidimicrobiales bacterium]
MTLTQLEAFVLVARLGSVKAAARVLGVSEPAVSGALAALRQHLGDPLVVRAARGMDLTAGGQRLLPIASRMVTLAADAADAIRRAQGAPEQLRVVATSAVAEYLARPLITAFTARTRPVEVALDVTTAAEMPALLSERLADVGLGPRLAGLDSRPMMRHRLVVVAGPDHPLARATRIGTSSLACHDWLVDPSGAEPASEVGQLLVRLRVPPARVRVFPSLRDAWAAAAEGEGVAPGIAHLLAHDVEQGWLVVLPVRGTPVDLLWHASSLPADRCTATATRLRRFLDTPDAMHAMHRADAGVPVARFRPPVHVTLWS